ncbi:MAG: class I SAM-dependent methyltransferase, partial [Pseudonocardia sp.]
MPQTQRARSAARSWVYDRFVAGLTAPWYRAALQRMPQGSHVLDVGIGTGAAIVRAAELVRARDLRIVGLDIDRDYYEFCHAAVARAGLDAQVTPCLCSVYDHEGGPYDVVYFSASLMLLPDPVEAMRHVAKQLVPGGRILFTQTFHHRRSGRVEPVKPMLGRLTT